MDVSLNQYQDNTQIQVLNSCFPEQSFIFVGVILLEA